MDIVFKFDFQKAVGTMVYFLQRLGSIDKVKLAKLLYIADRNHFVRHGYPITGSRQVAMDRGPLPSECLKLLDGEWSDPEAVFQFVHVDDNSVKLRDDSPIKFIEEVERSTIDLVIQSFGKTPTWDLVNHTHQFPEYKEVYVPGTSKTITYESLLRYYKKDAGFRLGRPVVSEATLKHMTFPFTAKSDADL